MCVYSKAKVSAGASKQILHSISIAIKYQNFLINPESIKGIKLNSERDKNKQT